MRAYFFGNFMLSSIQQGLQAAHVVAEMALRYQGGMDEHDVNMFYDWAENHKTVYLMNGGNQEGVREIAKFFDSMTHSHMGGKERSLPWAVFHEDEESLNECMTSVGIVVPEYIYRLSYDSGKESVISKLTGYNENVYLYRDSNGELIEQELTEFEIKLAELLKNYRYAS